MFYVKTATPHFFLLTNSDPALGPENVDIMWNNIV